MKVATLMCNRCISNVLCGFTTPCCSAFVCNVCVSNPKCPKCLLDFVVSSCKIFPSEVEKRATDERQTNRRRNIFNSYLILRNSENAHSDGTFVTHIVVPTDTLQGISLKYCTTVAELKRINKLTAANIHERGTLKVPARKQAAKDNSGTDNSLTEEEMEDLVRRRLVNRFRLVTSVREPSEALYYLEIAEFDFDQALTAFNEDISWERQNIHLIAAHRHHHHHHHNNNNAKYHHSASSPSPITPPSTIPSSKVAYTQKRIGCLWF